MTDTNKRILLVDDQKVMAQLLSFELTSVGHKVTVAYNGVEALTTLYSQTFDVLVTDLFMPEMGGMELIQNIKHQKMEIPTIVLSASRKGEVAQKLIDMGIIHFIDKPITDDKITLLTHLIDTM